MENRTDRKQKFVIVRQDNTLPNTRQRHGNLARNRDEIVEYHHVRASIRLLNKYVRRFHEIAISDIMPLSKLGAEEPAGFRIRVEGPANQVRFFSKLLEEADLKIL